MQAPGLSLGDNPPIMSEPTPQQVREFIAAGLPCEHLEVEGDGRHFFATIVSDAFDGQLARGPAPAGLRRAGR